MEESFNVLNSFIDSIAVINKSGEIIFTNSAWKMFSNNNQGDLLKADCGVNYLSQCSDEDEIIKGIKQVQQRIVNCFEFEYPCHSETEKRWFIMRALPFYLHDGLSIVSHINITERKLAEELVEEKNKMVVQLNDRLQTTLYKLAHDIQSPISSIEGLINLTKFEEMSDTIETYFGIIEKSIVDLKAFIQETLMRTNTGIKIEQINFETLVNNYISSIRYIKAVGNIDFKVAINQTNLFYSDKNEILTIFTNLIHNSIKYLDNSKVKSTIEINVWQNSGIVTFSIKDNGIGIQQHLLSEIYTMNFQIEENSQKGVGLGLSLVNKAVSLIGGTIEVKSEVRVFTEFIVTLPNLLEQ